MAINNSSELGKKTTNAGKTITLGNGNKREYNAEGTSYADYRSDGSQAGAGLSGTEDLGRDTNGNSVSSSRSGGGGSSLGSSNFQDKLEQLKKAQLSASMAGLDKQRNSSLSNLSAERATIEPQYQKSKTQAGVTAKQTARSFDEYMAQRGGSKSGIAGQGTLLNNVAYQGQLGSLNQAESADIANNARRVTDVNNAYESDLIGARAGIEAQALQNYISQMNQDRVYNQQNYQFDTNTGLQRDQFDTTTGIQRDQFNQNLGLQQAGLTGIYNGQQTLQSKTAQQDQEYRLANLNLQQQAQTWQQQFQEQGFTADEAYKAAQLKMAQEQMNLDNQYRYTALNRSSSGGGSSSASITAQKYAQEQDSKIATAEAFDVLNNLANQGKTRSEIFKALKDNYASFVNGNVNMDELWKMADQSFEWDG